ncbi:MAG: mitochondrial fission ELM1 family protein [Pseudomonadota bacterium]|nr:mitochondrial fission ELM1 family protein [Pseudomonadota bacterium]
MIPYSRETPNGWKMQDHMIWTLTDGKVGMVNQAFGLAQAIARELGGFRVIEKKIVPSRPWSMLPANLWPPGISGMASPRLEAPWPNFIVGCGRHAIGPALWIKKRSAGKTRLIHAQHPRIAVSHYDAIVAQSHDSKRGPNVIEVLGSMHSLTEAGLLSATERIPEAIAAVAKPVVAVLIGGTNSTYRLTKEIACRLVDDLWRLVEGDGYGLLVSTSRRTGADIEKLLRERLSGPKIYFWDGSGENPYFAMLALADAILATSDSVNMVSEASYTGKPVYVITLAGGEGSKFERFHAEMHRQGFTNPFRGKIEIRESRRLDETARAAREIATRLAFCG